MILLTSIRFWFPSVSVRCLSLTLPLEAYLMPLVNGRVEPSDGKVFVELGVGAVEGVEGDTG